MIYLSSCGIVYTGKNGISSILGGLSVEDPRRPQWQFGENVIPYLSVVHSTVPSCRAYSSFRVLILQECIAVLFTFVVALAPTCWAGGGGKGDGRPAAFLSSDRERSDHFALLLGLRLYRPGHPGVPLVLHGRR